MKVQQVSDQNFNGSLKWVNATGDVQDLTQALVPKIKSYYLEMKDLVADKPYDLFVSKPNEIDGFYKLDANVNYENILNGDKTVKGKSVIVNENYPERLPVGARDAMLSFERASAYSELNKPEGFFQMLWRYIRG